MTKTVLHLTTVHPRSDIRIFVKEARTLARLLPHRIVLVVADGQGDVDRGPRDVLIHDIGRLRGHRLGRILSGFRRSYSAIRRIRPDVVHFHDPELIPLGLLLRLMGTRVVYDVHEDVPELALSRAWVPGALRIPGAWALGALEWIGAQLFDLIVVATPKIGARFRPAKTTLVQNFPIRAELADPVSMPYATRPLEFAYAGVIARSRSAVEMVRAIGLIGNPRVRLHLAGTCASRDLDADLRDEPGWAYVEERGQLERRELASLLGQVRAGLVLFYPEPNHIDAQPNKMFEYMSVGLPVIASDFPLWRAIIGKANCGLLVNPQDPSAIAEAILWILANPHEAETMGRRGREAVEETYNWEAEALKLVRAYEHLLSA